MNATEMTTAPVDLDAPTSSGDRCNPSLTRDQENIIMPESADVAFSARRGSLSGRIERLVTRDGGTSVVDLTVEISGLPDASSTDADVVIYDAETVDHLAALIADLQTEYEALAMGYQR